jgi:hypothetical protein
MQRTSANKINEAEKPYTHAMCREELTSKTF